jgi:uncharacterized protein (TIGR02679 family)
VRRCDDACGRGYDGDVRERKVFVCENPNIVTIVADHLGIQRLPLICTDGMTAAAQRVMLPQRRAVNAALRYHGDFDRPGIRIAKSGTPVASSANQSPMY